MESNLPILPQEIIVHILSKLPAKSIARCRCLSKPLRTILSTPSFINTHLSHLRNSKPHHLHQSLLLFSTSCSVFSVPLTFNNDAHQLFDEMSEPATKLIFPHHPHTWSRLLSSCHGLLLVSDFKDNVFVINPATREIKQLPPSPFAIEPARKDVSPSGSYIKDEPGGYKMFCQRTLPLSWYPVDDHTTYALGYDSLNDDYKVVTLSFYEYTDRKSIFIKGDGTEFFVNVYSLKNATWTKADSFQYRRIVGHITSGVFVNGLIHWVASEEKLGHGEILAFDLGLEKFYEVAHPRSIGTLVVDSFLEIGGCLCFTRDYYGHGTEVWILKEYGNPESWTNFILVQPDEKYFKPLCLLGVKKMMLVKNPRKKCHSFVTYDMGKGTFKDIKLHGIPEDFQAGGTFVESLASPHCNHESN